MSETDRAGIGNNPGFAAFWFYRATEARFELEPDDAGAIPTETVTIFEDHKDDVTLRGVYSTIGFSANVDLIFWVVSDDMRKLHALAADLHASAFSAFFELTRILNGRPSERSTKTGAPAAKRYLSLHCHRDAVAVPAPETLPPPGYHPAESALDVPEPIVTSFDIFGDSDYEQILTLETAKLHTALNFERLHSLANKSMLQLERSTIIVGLRLPLDEAISVAL